MSQARSTSPTLLIPGAPVLVAGIKEAVWLSPDGEVAVLSLKEAGQRSKQQPPIVCHGRETARRLGLAALAAYDVLELYAFVRPADFCLPTPQGLAMALDLALPGTAEAEAESLLAVTQALLSELADPVKPLGREVASIAWTLQRDGWPWGAAVLAALGEGDAPHTRTLRQGLRIWEKLQEWREYTPGPAPDAYPVEPVEARARLVQLLGSRSEDRPEQAEYASAVAAAFLPRDKAEEPHLVLAEAGTGVGKTLGYIAPASVWSEKNHGSVWFSTYTRNLQRQLDGELDRLYPDPAEKARRVVIRKGRENYLCLLNFEEAVNRSGSSPGTEDGIVALGLMARWALNSRDGDMVGGDFPSWLSDLLGRRLTIDLTDTRGECIYSACAHYNKCFIERSIRRARRAGIVVANHALVMIQAALGGAEDGLLPSRYVFDEGHQIFEAADGAFSAHLSALEAADLRRWLLGAEGRRRSRSRGLKTRIEDLISGIDKANDALIEVTRAAHALPGPGWGQRLAGGEPVGPAEAFLSLVRQQVYARETNAGSPYSLESSTHPPVPGLLEAAGELEGALSKLSAPVGRLIGILMALLDDEADELDTATRQRIEAVSRSLDRRCIQQVQAWRDMLGALQGETPPQFVDWLSVERIDGRDWDMGLHRHWIDPGIPFTEAVVDPAHGVLVTSATLRDLADHDHDEEAGWPSAEIRTGARHLAAGCQHTAVPSPFDYAALTRVLVVGDVRRDDPDQVAAAYRELFLAAGGGGLGLFTAISRLKAIRDRIAGPLDEAGLRLLAQHVDAMDTGTLIDIFRAEEDTCLLGTDAVRDGIDVPGRSLRLIVFDRVPWPRPDLMHRARREAFGGRTYDEMLVRLKLKQAYGRLIRRADDRGVFVMLDRSLPSRLSAAFPEGVEVQRLGLRDALQETRRFLHENDD